MAFSKSVIKAQIIISCQLCETETKIKWKCLDCLLLMCEKYCERIHPKFKSAKDHRIIDIKEVGLHEESKNLDFTNIKCKQHPGQSCCLFCTTCDRLVCPSCIAKAHTGHGFLEIKEVYDMKLERLKNGQRKLEKGKADLAKEVQDMNTVNITQDSKCKKALQDILVQKGALIKAVNHNADKLSEEVQQQMKNMQDSFSNNQTKAEVTNKCLEEQTKKSEEIINTRDTSRFFDEVDDLVKSMEEVVIPPFNITYSYMPNFIPGEITKSNVGLLKNDTSSDATNTKIEMKVNKQFTTDLNHIHYLAVSEDGSLWIADNISKVLKKVKQEGHQLETISTFNIEINGISVTPSNDLLLSTGKSILQQICVGTEELTNSKYTVHQLYPTAIHFTRDQKVIIGARNKGKPFPRTGRRVVIIMNMDGEQLVVYEHDKDNEPLFTYPMSITSTGEGNIYIVDRMDSNMQGRIVLIGLGGYILSIYTGHPNINTENKPFSPTAIATTKLDGIIVTDKSTLHIVNSNGQLIMGINTMDKGIEFPYSLAFSPGGKLYIGCLTFKSIPEKAKLYEIELSGC